MRKRRRIRTVNNHHRQKLMRLSTEASGLVWATMSVTDAGVKIYDRPSRPSRSRIIRDVVDLYRFFKKLGFFSHETKPDSQISEVAEPATAADAQQETREGK